MTEASHTADRVEAAAKLLPRRRFFSDMPDRGLFGVVALGGFVGIVLLKVNGLNADVIAVLAVAVMAAYGYAAFSIPLVSMRPDRLGDNFYYLGFIFTLASLTAALLQLRKEVSVNLLLESFGIALVTTIFGIAGRVLFVQLRSDIDDVEETVQRDLAATSAELRAQLGQSIREFETFRTTMVQVLTETRDEIVRSQKSQVANIETLATDAAKKIDAAFSDQRMRSDELNSAVSSTANAVRGATERLSEMRLPSDELNAQLVSFSQNLEAILVRLGGIVESVARQSVRRSWFA